MKLDFLSGYNPRKGYKKCDYIPMVGLDYLFNIDTHKLEGIDDNSVKRIWTKNALHHIPDLQATIQEFNRVLKPNGVVIVTECSEKAYKVNAFLDKLWYSVLKLMEDVWFSPVYRDYEEFFLDNNFKLLYTKRIEHQEIKVFRRV